MKITLAVVAALAASVSAKPIRIITITGAPVDNLHAFDAVPAEEAAAPLVEPTAQRKPCHQAQVAKGQGSPSFFPGPIGALLSRLGMTRESGRKEHHHGWNNADSAVREGKTLFDALKEHMEEVQGKVVPIMEGGMVNILPVTNEEGLASPSEVEEKQDEHRHKHHGHKHHEHEEHDGKMRVHGEKHHHGHHKHHKAHSFGGRLHRALNNLSSAESLGMAFVLGAGLGSILHFFFMIVLLSVRRFRSGGSGLSCSERRKARREARKARKAARNGGAVQLSGEDEIVRDEKAVEAEGEMLPSYQEGETDRLVVAEEKA